MTTHRQLLRLLVCALVAVIAVATVRPAMADVTETKSMTFDMGFLKVNSTVTERISGDKKRTDTDARCEGRLLSMFCGDMAGGEIVRLDKNLGWRLEPKKKSYVETPFPTPDQIAAAKQARAAWLEKLKDCPQPAGSAAPDTRRCQMSPPKFDVGKTGETETIAGHPAEHAWITMTRTCANQETGDACEFVVRIDSWLTHDRIPGLDEERSFRDAYDLRMGLDPATLATVGAQFQKFLAPYADALRQIGDKSSDLQGIALKTTIRISTGGTHCAAARQRQQQQAGSVTADAGGAAEAAAATSTTAATGTATEQAVERSTGGSVLGSVAGATAGALGRGIVGGLFAKKKAAPPPAAAEAATQSVDASLVRLVSITAETTAIRTDSIPSDQFDAPADWKRLQPPPSRLDEAPSCPKVNG